MTTEAELVDEYPDIYQFYHEYDKQPAPQIHLYGFQHNDGWNWLIAELCEQLDNLDVEIAVVQQKEKFGGLRFYHNGVSGDRAMEAMGAIRFAEKLSFQICEECGERGELRRDSWFRTRCDECYEA